MQKGIILSSADIKRILAEYFNVAEENVISTKYSYVIAESEVKDENNSK